MKILRDNGTEMSFEDKEINRLRINDLVYYCNQCKVYHANENLYVIRQNVLVDGEQLYWSNKDGWSALAGATIFSGYEKENARLPLGGEWGQIAFS